MAASNGAAGTSGMLQLSFADAGEPDTRRTPTHDEIEALRGRVPGSLGIDTVRDLVAMPDEELGASLDRITPDVTRFLSPDLRPLTRWYKLVSSPNDARTVRAYVAGLEEVGRRGGMAHRPLTMAAEAEILPLVGLAIPEWALSEIQRRVARYPELSTIPAGDFEWNRIRDTARWATQRLAELARELGGRAGPAGQRVRELYAPWLLDADQPEEAARLLTAMERAPGHDSPTWVYLEARALAALGRDDEATRAMARLPAPSTLGLPEPSADHFARMRVRAASLERSTRDATTAQGVRDRVWALLLLGRYGDARNTALNAPAAIATDPLVEEARVVSMAVDGEGGNELWNATQSGGANAREGFSAVRAHAAFLRAGRWSFPRRTTSAAWHPTDPEALAELRRILPTIHTAEPVPIEPLQWQVELLSLPPSPAGPAQSPAGRRLLASLDHAREGNDKSLQLYAAMTELLLLASSGEAQRAVELLRTVRAEPDSQDIARDGVSLAAAFATVIDPSESNRDRLYADLEQRVADERNTRDERVATALVFDAHALAVYLTGTEGSEDDRRQQLAMLVRRAAYEIVRRSENAGGRAGTDYPGIFLQGMLLARTDVDALPFVAGISEGALARYGSLLTGVRAVWAGDVDASVDSFRRCASDDLPPFVATRCARWLAAVARQRHDATLQRRAAADAERYANLARETDGPMAATHTPGPGADFIPVLNASPETQIDLETWRLTHRWTPNVSWVFAPDVPTSGLPHRAAEPTPTEPAPEE